MAAWSWRLIVAVAALALVVWAVDKVLLALVAVFLALVFTAVMLPLVGVLARRVPRGLATALALLSGVLVVAVAVTFVVTSAVGQWDTLEGQLDDSLSDLARWVRQESLPVPLPEDEVESWTQRAMAWVREHQDVVVARVMSGLGTAGLVLTTLALALFLTVFFLARGGQMWGWFLDQLPSDVGETWRAGGEAAWSAFSGYTAGTVVIALVDAVLAVILLLVLGVPLAVPLAVLVFIGALIPLVGAPAAMLIAMVVALVANGPVSALVVGIGIALIGQIEGHLLEPLVMARAVRIHPVVIALAVTIGALVAGILGAVLAVPVVATAWAVFTRLRDPSDVPAHGGDGAAPP
ncbi:AI-2E family transporter [uncultured Cellulomonas sp.]|uniref:AI-2E family transporter n=1 Tax=uncultured Cellulomonas sp. TaxID=189682 RepID=UPI00260CB66F|nr:AI-2E family transporter [uncultured Cellulomonas sp.]